MECADAKLTIYLWRLPGLRVVTETMTTTMSVLRASNLPLATPTVVLGGEVYVHHRVVVVMERCRILKSAPKGTFRVGPT